MTTGLDNTLDKNLRKLSRASLIVHGIGYILLIVGMYVLFPIAFAASMAYQPFGSFNPAATGLFVLMIIAATALLLTGVFVIKTGLKIGKGNISRMSIFIPILMFAIFLIFAGIAGLVIANDSYYGSSIRNASILSIISGALFIAGPLIYMREHQTPKLVGAIISIAGVGLLIAGGRSFLNSVFDLKNLYFSDLLGGELAYAGFIVCGAAAMAYSFLKNKKYVEIAYLIVVIGFVLYGVNVAIQTLEILSSSVWDLPGYVLAFLSVILAGIILLSISGFMILASSGIGLAVFLRKIFPEEMAVKTDSVSQTSTPEPTPNFCQKCGTKIEQDADFCKKCGTKLK